METFAAIMARHSTREFTGKPIERGMIEKIIDAARLAPTARNVQPWDFVVVTDAAMRARLAHLTDFGKFIAQAPVCVAVFCRDTKYYLEDGANAATTLLLAAADLGVQSCWVAGDKKAYCPQAAALLGVPADHKLIALLALGYAATAPVAPPKRPLAEVLHWEKF